MNASWAAVTQRQLHKFGGSSLADAHCFIRVANIMANYGQHEDLIVVSAAGKTTNHLIEWLTQYHQHNQQAQASQQALVNYQQTLIEQLINDSQQRAWLIQQFQQDIDHLCQLLATTAREQHYATVVGHGEIWSARLLAALLNQQHMAARWLDARTFLIAERAAQPWINEALSAPLLATILQQQPQQRLVITGFIASSENQETLLLGRNGSDYSATQIAALAGIKQVTIWSDVAGVYSADPHKVKSACLLPLLRLDEASELARLAAPVLHARTLQPVAHHQLALQLRSSHYPEQGSTSVEPVLASGSGAKIVTSHQDICLITLTMPDPCLTEQTQQTLAQLLDQQQMLPLFSQHSAQQHTIWLAYTREVAQDALTFLQQRYPLPTYQLTCQYGLSLLALVGAGVGKNLLHCHRFRQLLQQQPVLLTWQSPSQISLCALLEPQPNDALLVSLHDSIFRAEKQLGVVLFGKQPMGERWLTLFAQQQQRLSARTKLAFVLVGVVDQQLAVLDNQGLDPQRVLGFFQQEARVYSTEQLTQWLTEHPYDDLVIVDTTQSDLYQQYPFFAENGFHVISANQQMGGNSQQQYQYSHDAFNKTQRHWLYSATVGANLPVNIAVRELRESGDTLLAISGIFSAALSWLFCHFDNQQPFSAWVQQAQSLGIISADNLLNTLSGQEVLHQLVILTREAGYRIEPQQIRLEALLSQDDDWHWQQLDQQMAHRFAAAQEMGLVLRYVARFDHKGVARIGIEALSHSHPLAALSAGDNVFAIESRWYRDKPLIIRGPVLGDDVLAGALQSDLNQLAKLL